MEEILRHGTRRLTYHSIPILLPLFSLTVDLFKKKKLQHKIWVKPVTYNCLSLIIIWKFTQVNIHQLVNVQFPNDSFLRTVIATPWVQRSLLLLIVLLKTFHELWYENYQVLCIAHLSLTSLFLPTILSWQVSHSYNHFSCFPLYSRCRRYDGESEKMWFHRIRKKMFSTSLKCLYSNKGIRRQ